MLPPLTTIKVAVGVYQFKGSLCCLRVDILRSTQSKLAFPTNQIYLGQMKSRLIIKRIHRWMIVVKIQCQKNILINYKLMLYAHHQFQEYYKKPLLRFFNSFILFSKKKVCYIKKYAKTL